MDLDHEKIDNAVLALLLLGTSGNRAWKGYDADVLDRLHQKGLIDDPRTKSLSIVFTGEGLSQAKKLLEELFGRER